MENRIDPAQEQRVWSRVMAAQSAARDPQPTACTRLAQKDAPVFDADAVLALHTAQRRAAAVFRALADRARGCTRQTLLRLAEEKCRETKRLAAVYFLMQGTCLCPETMRTPCVRRVCQTLKDACQEERCAAALYRRYAARNEDYAPLLTQMADRSEQSARCLFRLLAQSL